MSEERASRTRWRSVEVFLAVLLLTLAGGIVFLWKTVPPVDPEALRECPATPVVFDREGRMLRAYLAPDGAWSLPVSLDAMGTWLPKVAVEVEDRRFFSHPGVDLIAIFRALAGNIHEGRVISGASTITSQLVRLTVPRPRTMRAKAEEFFQALRLERRFSKEQILELYLNKAPSEGTSEVWRPRPCFISARVPVLSPWERRLFW
jgi:penicillin-binding protein 1C